MIYLLDSNVWVAILRQNHPQVAARYGTTNSSDIRTCSVVVFLGGDYAIQFPVDEQTATSVLLLGPIAGEGFTAIGESKQAEGPPVDFEDGLLQIGWQRQKEPLDGFILGAPPRGTRQRGHCQGGSGDLYSGLTPHSRPPSMGGRTGEVEEWPSVPRVSCLLR